MFVLDLKGRVLLSRDYRGDVSLKVAEKFIIKLNELEEAGKARSCAVRLQDTIVPPDALHLCSCCAALLRLRQR